MTKETRERMDNIKNSSFQGGQIGLSIGIILGTFSYIFAGRVPLFRGRMQSSNFPTYMALGATCCCSGAVFAGRDFFSYAFDVLKKVPEVDPEIYGSNGLVSQISSYQRILQNNDREIIDRLDEAFENRRKAIEQFNHSKYPKYQAPPNQCQWHL
jgi:hypothetical protein